MYLFSYRFLSLCSLFSRINPSKYHKTDSFQIFHSIGYCSHMPANDHFCANRWIFSILIISFSFFQHHFPTDQRVNCNRIHVYTNFSNSNVYFPLSNNIHISISSFIFISPNILPKPETPHHPSPQPSQTPATSFLISIIFSVETKKAQKPCQTKSGPFIHFIQLHFTITPTSPSAPHTPPASS